MNLLHSLPIFHLTTKHSLSAMWQTIKVMSTPLRQPIHTIQILTSQQNSTLCSHEHNKKHRPVLLGWVGFFCVRLTCYSDNRPPSIISYPAAAQDKAVWERYERKRDFEAWKDTRTFDIVKKTAATGHLLWCSAAAVFLFSYIFYECFES